MNLAYEWILAERERQITECGWCHQHDDKYRLNELERAADCYATFPDTREINPETNAPYEWPWDPMWWKPGDRERELTKAGALYLAQKERYIRHQQDVPQILLTKLGAVEESLQKLIAPEPLSGKAYRHIKNYIVNELGFGRLKVEALFYRYLTTILTRLVEQQMESPWVQRTIKLAVFSYLERPSQSDHWSYGGRSNIPFHEYVDRLAKEVIQEEITRRIDFNQIKINPVNEP